MTKVTIDGGICGFRTTVAVSDVDRRNVSVVLTSECEMVASMGGQLQDLAWMEALCPPTDSAVWDCA